MKIKWLGTLLLSGCLLNNEANAQSAVKFIDPANMDLTVKPGDDFYTYASGNWL
jgi:predicted metalloendopeptidase